jgi:hypothetical protein
MKPESIKCRAKRLDNGEVVEGWYVNILGCHEIYNGGHPGPDISIHVDPATLQLCSEAELKIKPKEFKDWWNAFPELPKITTMTGKRKKQLATRCKEQKFFDNWKDIIQKMADSPFLTGKEANWHADVTWFLVNDENYTKVHENKYSVKKQPQSGVQRETSQDKLKREMAQ